MKTKRLLKALAANNYPAILTAYIISPSWRKGLSSSNSSVLYLRASNMMHCGLRFKCRGQFSGVRWSHVKSFAPPTSLGGGRCCILYFTRLLPWQSRVSSHNLASHVRAIVCSENDLLASWAWTTCRDPWSYVSTLPFAAVFWDITQRSSSLGERCVTSPQKRRKTAAKEITQLSTPQCLSKEPNYDPVGSIVI